jgi:hypothetical protein
VFIFPIGSSRLNQSAVSVSSVKSVSRTNVSKGGVTTLKAPSTVNAKVGEKRERVTTSASQRTAGASSALNVSTASSTSSVARPVKRTRIVSATPSAVAPPVFVGATAAEDAEEDRFAKTFGGELTRPVSPRFATDSRKRKVHVLSSMEAELAKIEAERHELEERRKFAKLSKERALRAQPTQNISNVHSTKPLTEPVEFHFQSDARIKGPVTRNRAKVVEKKPVKRVAHRTAGGLTEVEPFHFASDSRVRASSVPKDADSSSNAGTPFRTLAEQVKTFQSKTPKRFHTASRSETTPSLNKYLSNESHIKSIFF